jgi:hypothetical protein
MCDVERLRRTGRMDILRSMNEKMRMEFLWAWYFLRLVLSSDGLKGDGVVKTRSESVRVT